MSCCPCVSQAYQPLHLDDRRVQIGIVAGIVLIGVIWAKYFRDPLPPQPKSIQITSYNTLAPTMAQSGWYDHIDSALMLWENRQKALLDRISSFDSDLICLQEVEPKFFQSALDLLRKQGYEGKYVRKLQNHPDGLAFFYKPTSVKLVDYEVIYFTKSSAVGRDWRPAQIITLEHRGRQIGLVNTHLAWDSAGELAHTQLTELVSTQIQLQSLDGWMLCGDFSVTPDQVAIDFLREHGFQSAYNGVEQMTCSIKEFTGKVDYILYSSDSLRATADRIEELILGHVLPSPMQPSDHIAITARITHL